MFISSKAPSDVAPLVVKPREARSMLACGNTRLYELLAAKELDSFLDGRSRKITVDSIRRYIARRLAPVVSPTKDTEPHRRGRSGKTPRAAGAHAP
jgi:hypothetical protein